jgi:hypothetical protein
VVASVGYWYRRLLVAAGRVTQQGVCTAHDSCAAAGDGAQKQSCVWDLMKGDLPLREQSSDVMLLTYKGCSCLLVYG